jgi:hypothetical protein
MGIAIRGSAQIAVLVVALGCAQSPAAVERCTRGDDIAPCEPRSTVTQADGVWRVTLRTPKRTTEEYMDGGAVCRRTVQRCDIVSCTTLTVAEYPTENDAVFACILRTSPPRW